MISREKIYNSLSNPFFLVFLIIQFIVIILFFSSFSNFINKKTEESMNIAQDAGFNIINLKDTISGLNDSEIEAIKYAVFFWIGQNNSHVEQNTKAKIRKDTFIKKEFNVQNLTYYNFIVDIPSLKQSYQVAYERSDDKENIYVSPDDALVVTCVSDKSKIKYKEQNCIDSNQRSGPVDVINRYLQYADFGDLGVEVNYDAEEKNVIIINATASNKNEDEAIAYVQDWIKSMGYSPDGFVFSVNKGEYFSEFED